MASPTLNPLGGISDDVLLQIVDLLPFEDIFSLGLAHPSLKGKLCSRGGLNRFIGRHHDTVDNSPWPIDFLRSPNPALPTKAHARFVLADSNARSWAIFPSKRAEHATAFDPARYSVDAYKWTSQLAVKLHPFISNINIRSTIRLFEPMKGQSFCANVWSFLFTITYAILEQYSGSRGQGGATNLQNLQTELLDIHHSLDNLGFEKDNQPLVALLAPLMLHQYFTNAGVVNIAPPTPSRIHFCELMDLPLPFVSVSTHTYQIAHLKTMTSKTFLESGTWLFCAIRKYRPLCRAMIEGFEFNIRQQARRVPGGEVLEVRSEVSTDYADLLLQGTIKHNGRLRMTLSSEHAMMWDFEGKMTPFGIVGGGQGDDDFVWMWKREWSH